jgi:nucleotide-binding universal stress UspA family protein
MSVNQEKPLVVAVDGSAPAWGAMDTAMTLAKLMSRQLIVLTVVQLVKAGYFAFIDRHLQEEQEVYGQNVLKEAVARGRQEGVEIIPNLLQTPKNPAEAILEFLETGGPYKMLVIGSHGHGFVARHLLGSVTERVVREVAHRGIPVPVLVVPPAPVPE